MKLLIVIDMQNDFIDGSLGTKEAVAIVPNVAKKLPVPVLQVKPLCSHEILTRAIILKLRKERIFRFCTALKEVTDGRFRASWK